MCGLDAGDLNFGAERGEGESCRFVVSVRGLFLCHGFTVQRWNQVKVKSV